GEMERAHQVDGEVVVPGGGIGGDERRHRPAAGVVDEDVDPPEDVEGGGDRRLQFRAEPDIGHHRMEGGTTAEPAGQLLERGPVPVDRQDPHAGAEQTSGDLLAHAPGGTGDQRHALCVAHAPTPTRVQRTCAMPWRSSPLPGRYQWKIQHTIPAIPWAATRGSAPGTKPSSAWASATSAASRVMKRRSSRVTLPCTSGAKALNSFR